MSKAVVPKAAALGIDMSEFFRQDALSDVTLHFSGREMKCHKIILCARSEYFRKLCGPESGFAEATQPVIELEEDDPTALEALLRNIYTFQYVDDAEKRKDDWMFHLNYAVVARKYGFIEEGLKARVAFTRIVNSIEAPDAVCSVITALPAFADQFSGISKHAEKLIEKHMPSLLRLGEFRTYLHADEDMLWRLMAKLVPTCAKVEVSVFECSKPNCSAMARGPAHCKPKCHLCQSSMVAKFTCWVPVLEAELKYY